MPQEVFELRDGSVIVLPVGATYGTISEDAWNSRGHEERAQFLGQVRQTVERAMALRRAEEDPRIGILRNAVLEVRRDAHALASVFALSPGGEVARRMVLVLENVMDLVAKIERGR